MIIDPENNRVFKKKSVLQQLASGGWILEPQFLEDSEAEGRFLKEDDYVVGVGSKSTKLNDSRFACWRRWRELRLERGTGAFDGWKVVLFSASADREKGHRTLLTAGGATVLPEDRLSEATHVFLAKGDSATAKKVRTRTSDDAKVLANEYMLHYLSNAEVSHRLHNSKLVLEKEYCLLPHWSEVLLKIHDGKYHPRKVINENSFSGESGAVFNSMNVRGTLTKIEVRSEFSVHKIKVDFMGTFCGDCFHGLFRRNKKNSTRF